MKKLLATSAIILALVSTSGIAQAKEWGRHGGMHKHIEETLAKLPEDKANLFRDTMKKVREENQGQREKLRTIGQEIKDIVNAPEFDKNAYLAKTHEAQVIFGEMGAKRSAAFADVLSQLNQDERKIIVEAMPHGPKHHDRHGTKGEEGHHEGVKPLDDDTKVE